MNLVSVFILSIGLYFVYVWVTNYISISNTYASVPSIFASPLFYLTVVVCSMFCYVIDLFIEGWKFEFRTNPTDFLRKVIHRGKDIQKYLQEFTRLYIGIKAKYVDVDIEREVKIEEKRDLRVNKYGPNKFKDIKKKEHKKQIKNEIELEFLD